MVTSWLKFNYYNLLKDEGLTSVIGCNRRHRSSRPLRYSAFRACQNEQAIGCGAFKKFDTNTAEIKRMYVKQAHRGSGVANTVLSSLEQWASEEGFIKCILETGSRQLEANKFYKKSGYRSIPNYGQYTQVEDSNCFEKLV